MSLILGQLRHTQSKTVSVGRGTVIKVPFNVVDYAENCKGIVPYAQFIIERNVLSYTAYFNITVATLRHHSRVEVPFSVAVRVNGKVTGSTDTAVNYFGPTKATTYSGAIPVKGLLNVGDRVDLILHNLSSFTDLVFQASSFVINEGAREVGAGGDLYEHWIVVAEGNTFEVKAHNSLIFSGANGIGVSLAGNILTIDGGNTQSELYKVKYSTADLKPGYLSDKIVAGIEIGLGSAVPPTGDPDNRRLLISNQGPFTRFDGANTLLTPAHVKLRTAGIPLWFNGDSEGILFPDNGNQLLKGFHNTLSLIPPTRVDNVYGPDWTDDHAAVSAKAINKYLNSHTIFDHWHKEINIRDLNRMRWMGIWVQKTLPHGYVKNDVVVEGSWTMICVVQETTDHASPQPVGSPTYSAPDTPTFVTTVSPDTVRSGQKFSFTAPGTIKTIRGWIPSEHPSGSVDHTFIVRDETDPDPTKHSETIIASAISHEDAWEELADYEKMVHDGTVLIFIVETKIHPGSHATQIHYARQDDYWPTHKPHFATVEGYLIINGVPSSDLATHNALFGMDIQFQEVTMSSDWAVVATSSGGITGGHTTPVISHPDILNRDAVDSHPSLAIGPHFTGQTNLPGDLDYLKGLIDNTLNIVHPAVLDNIVTLKADGQLKDSGYSFDSGLAGTVTYWKTYKKLSHEPIMKFKAGYGGVTQVIIGNANNYTLPQYTDKQALWIAQDSEWTAGLAMKNWNTGTNASFRFSLFDTTGAYLAFVMPSINKAGTIFGLNRKTTVWMAVAGGAPPRDLAIGTNSTTDLILGTSDIARMIIQAAGNVGIGMASPVHKLDVTGDIHSSTNILARSRIGIGELNPRTALVIAAAPIGWVGNLMLKHPSATGHAAYNYVTSWDRTENGTGTTGRLWVFGNASTKNSDFYILTDVPESSVHIRPHNSHALTITEHVVGINVVVPDKTYWLDVQGKVRIAGDLKIESIVKAGTTYTGFLLTDSGIVKYRTLAEIKSDLGIVSATPQTLSWVAATKVLTISQGNHVTLTHTHTWAEVTGKPTTFPPSPHALVSSTHTVSGLTAGQVLMALTPTTFGFKALPVTIHSSKWNRDIAKGILYPKTLTDKVAVGQNTAVYNLDVKGTGRFTSILTNTGEYNLIGRNSKGVYQAWIKFTYTEPTSHRGMGISTLVFGSNQWWLGTMYQTGTYALRHDTQTAHSQTIIRSDATGTGKTIWSVAPNLGHFDIGIPLRLLEVAVSTTVANVLQIKADKTVEQITVANLVGDQLYWKRTGVILAPKTTGDRIKVGDWEIGSDHITYKTLYALLANTATNELNIGAGFTGVVVHTSNVQFENLTLGNINAGSPKMATTKEWVLSKIPTAQPYQTLSWVAATKVLSITNGNDVTLNHTHHWSEITDHPAPIWVRDTHGIYPKTLTDKVGIGTNSPTDILTVKGAINLKGHTAWDSGITPRIYKSDSHGLAIVGATGTTYDFGMFTPGGSALFVVPTGELWLNIFPTSPTGKVGIGTATPGSVLEVVGSTPILNVVNSAAWASGANTTLKLSHNSDRHIKIVGYASGNSHLEAQFWTWNGVTGSIVKALTLAGTGDTIVHHTLKIDSLPTVTTASEVLAPVSGVVSRISTANLVAGSLLWTRVLSGYLHPKTATDAVYLKSTGSMNGGLSQHITKQFGSNAFSAHYAYYEIRIPVDITATAAINGVFKIRVTSDSPSVGTTSYIEKTIYIASFYEHGLIKVYTQESYISGWMRQDTIRIGDFVADTTSKELVIKVVSNYKEGSRSANIEFDYVGKAGFRLLKATLSARKTGTVADLPPMQHYGTPPSSYFKIAKTLVAKADFLTRSSTGIVGKRTAAEVLADIGADNYAKWKVGIDAAALTDVTSAYTVKFLSGDNIKLTSYKPPVTNGGAVHITINAIQGEDTDCVKINYNVNNNVITASGKPCEINGENNFRYLDKSHQGLYLAQSDPPTPLVGASPADVNNPAWNLIDAGWGVVKPYTAGSGADLNKITGKYTVPTTGTYTFIFKFQIAVADRPKVSSVSTKIVGHTNGADVILFGTVTEFDGFDQEFTYTTNSITLEKGDTVWVEQRGGTHAQEAFSSSVRFQQTEDWTYQTSPVYREPTLYMVANMNPATHATLGMSLGKIGFQGIYQGRAKHTKPSAYITSTALENFGTNYGATLEFWTVAKGAHVATETMIIKGGAVGIGTVAPTEALEVAGKVKIKENTLSAESVTLDSSTAIGLRIRNKYGYVSITPLNSGTAHFYTDRPNFIFNKSVVVLGVGLPQFSSYNPIDLFIAANHRTTAAHAAIKISHVDQAVTLRNSLTIVKITPSHVKATTYLTALAGLVMSRTGAEVLKDIGASPVHSHHYLSNIYLTSQHITDADKADTKGIEVHYLPGTGLNKPPSVNDGALLTLSYSNVWSGQMFTDWRTNKWFGRNQDNGTWGAWKEFLMEGDVTANDGKLTMTATGSVHGSATFTANQATASTFAVTHLTTAGHKHIPTAGAANQFLKWSASGTAVWAALPAANTITLTGDVTGSGTTSIATENVAQRVAYLSGLALPVPKIHPHQVKYYLARVGTPLASYHTVIHINPYTGTSNTVQSEQLALRGNSMYIRSAVGTASTWGAWVQFADRAWVTSHFSNTKGTVTSIATSGAILGGPITTTGTITHSKVAGYKHIPSGGALNQYLKWSASGTVVWASLPATVHSSKWNEISHVLSPKTITNKVAIGKTTAAYSLDVTGNARVTKTLLATLGRAENSVGQLVFPKGGTYGHSASSVKGRIVITLPHTGSNTMMGFWVDVFDYGTKAFSAFINFYNYATGPNVILKGSFILSGNDVHTQYVIRAGLLNGKAAVTIGEITSPWAYPKVFVRTVHTGRSHPEPSYWESDWAVSIQATTTGFVEKSKLATNYPWSDYNKMINKPSSFTPARHGLVSSSHTVSGLTMGHVLMALTPTTFGFKELPIPDMTKYVAKAGDTMTGVLNMEKYSSNQNNTVYFMRARGIKATANDLVSTDIIGDVKFQGIADGSMKQFGYLRVQYFADVVSTLKGSVITLTTQNTLNQADAGINPIITGYEDGSVLIGAYPENNFRPKSGYLTVSNATMNWLQGDTQVYGRLFTTTGVQTGTGNVLSVGDSINTGFSYAGGLLDLNFSGSRKFRFMLGTGQFEADGDVIAFSSTISDKRLKLNIASLSYGLNEVAKLSPVSFVRKDSDDKRTHLGLIAQEVMDIIPEVVGEYDNHFTLNYTELIPVLINAVKELKAKVKYLEER